MLNVLLPNDEATLARMTPEQRRSAQLRQQFFRKIAARLGVATLLLGAIATTAYESSAHFLAANQEVKHTLISIKQLDSVLSHLKDAETGQRGFLLTGNSLYLAPYNTASRSLATDLKSLQELMANHGDQLQRINTLEPLISLKLDELQRTIELRRKHGLNDTLSATQLDEGKALMDQIRQITSQMEATENQLLVKHQEQVQETARTTLWVFCGGSILILAILVWVYSLVYQEMTERNRAEEKQQESLKQIADFKFALDQAALVVITDAQGVITYVNDKFCEVSKYSREELLGQTHRLINSEFHPKEFFQHMWSMIAKGKVWKGEIKNLAKDGSEFWVDTTIIPFLDEQQQPFQYLAIRFEVSDRRRAEEIRKGAQLLRLVLDNIPQHIYWKDCNSVYLGCNQKWAILKGLGEPESILGLTDYELWSSEEAVLFRSEDREVIDTAIPKLHIIDQRIGPDDQPIWLDVNKLPIHDTRGNVIGILGMIEDISDRKRAEQALRASEEREREKALQLEQLLKDLKQTQTQLIQTEKMSSLGQLVAGVAHEINNPVNFIYGNISHVDGYTQELLELVQLFQKHDPKPNLAVQQYIEQIDLDFLVTDLPKTLTSIRMGAERIRQIVLSLRNFSRLDEAEMKPVNIHEGIDSTLLILQNRLKTRPDHPGIHIVKDYSDLPLVECYVGQLNQVFMNILSNAIDELEQRDQQRSMEDIQNHPSVITIRTELPASDRVKIRIADNGVGIPDSVKHRLFDPFFTTKPVGKGTGLGLSISYQIITERHGGTIGCESTPGNGAEFWIEIPISQSCNLSSRQEQPEASAIARG